MKTNFCPELHTYHRDFRPDTTLPSSNGGVKGKDSDEPVANVLVGLKVGPAPRFPTGKVSGAPDGVRLPNRLEQCTKGRKKFYLSVLNGLFGGSSGSWNAAVAGVGNSPGPIVTAGSGLPGRANGHTALGGAAAEKDFELREQLTPVLATKARGLFTLELYRGPPTALTSQAEQLSLPPYF